MNVVDSSGWIEYLAGGANAKFFARPIEGEEPLLVPSLSLFAVYRHMLRHIGREEGLNVVAAMRRGTIVDLEDGLGGARRLPRARNPQQAYHGPTRPEAS